MIPDAEESRQFWSDIWDQPVTHRENTDWLRKCLQENNLPKWMVTGKTLKKTQKGNLVSNFGPVTCLPLIWKLLTDILAEELYEHFKKTNSLPWK